MLFRSVFKLFINLQSQHDELEAKFFEERAALEAKYQKLYQPLYTKVSYSALRMRVGYALSVLLIHGACSFFSRHL